MNHPILVAAVVSLGLLAAGCQTPSTVRALGAQLETANEATARAHLDTLQAYRASMEALRDEIESLGRLVVSLETVARERAEDAVRFRRQAVETQLLAQFDEQALGLLQSSFNEAMEARFWPSITEKFNAARAEEQTLKASLGANGSDPVLTKQYRDLSVHAENVLRKGFAREAELRRYAVDETMRVRLRLKQRIHDRLVAVATVPPQGLTDLVRLTDESRHGLQAAITSIEQAEREMQTAYREGAEAMRQINAYLNRPREWELVLQGLRAEATIAVGEYSAALASRADALLLDLQSRLGDRLAALDFTGDIDQAVDSLSTALDARIAGSEVEAFTASRTAAR